MNVEIGQVWKIYANSRRSWRTHSEVITITFVGHDYFTYKEDPEQSSWDFSLLKDHYYLSDKE